MLILRQTSWWHPCRGLDGICYTLRTLVCFCSGFPLTGLHRLPQWYGLLPCHNQLGTLYYLRDLWLIRTICGFLLVSCGYYLIEQPWHLDGCVSKKQLCNNKSFSNSMLILGLGPWHKGLPGGHVRSRAESLNLPVNILESSLSQTVPVHVKHNMQWLQKYLGTVSQLGLRLNQV